MDHFIIRRDTGYRFHPGYNVDCHQWDYDLRNATVYATRKEAQDIVDTYMHRCFRIRAYVDTVASVEAETEAAAAELRALCEAARGQV